MVGSYCKRNRQKKTTADTADLTETARRLAAERSSPAYYGNALKNADPIHMLTTSFTNNFDAVGRDRARQLSGNESGRNAEKSPEPGREREGVRTEGLRKEHDSPEYVHSSEELRRGEFTDRFSSYAFRGGKLAASVMAGQGKQMFTLCLARAIGRPMPQGERQKKLLGQSDTELSVINREADVRFNRDVYSAVGIVTDTLKSSGRLLELFRELATGSGQRVPDPLEFRNIDTLKQTLPFFDIDSDKKLITQYRQRLRQLEGDSSPEAAGSAKLLRAALTKQNALLRRKQQEQRDFLTVLDRITGNVREAEKLFSSDGFAEQAAVEAEELAADVPPDDNNGRRRAAGNIAEAVAGFLSGLRGETNAGADQQDIPPDQERTDAGKET